MRPSIPLSAPLLTAPTRPAPSHRSDAPGWTTANQTQRPPLELVTILFREGPRIRQYRRLTDDLVLVHDPSTERTLQAALYQAHGEVGDVNTSPRSA